MSDEMTTEDWRALGLRAVACKGWRWIRGCVYDGPWRDGGGGIITESGHPTRGYQCCFGGPEDAHEDPMTERWPDFRDPATLGCLLALVREAWGDPEAYGRPAYGGWEFYTGDYKHWSPGSEAEALVIALEAAP